MIEWTVVPSNRYSPTQKCKHMVYKSNDTNKRGMYKHHTLFQKRQLGYEKYIYLNSIQYLLS